MQKPKPRTVLSLDSVLDVSIAVLDESGAERLSVREVARRLHAGVASIYWYIDSKSQLVDLAVDRVLGQVTDQAVNSSADDGSDDPLAPLRALALRLFDTLDQHQWCAGHITQNPQRQPHSVQTLDLIGRHLASLGLTVEQQFHSSTALMTYVVGSCAQMANAQRSVSNVVTRRAHLAEAARRWDEVDPDELPFLRSAADVLRQHDDREQFEFGLDLMLDGIRELLGHGR